MNLSSRLARHAVGHADELMHGLARAYRRSAAERRTQHGSQWPHLWDTVAQTGASAASDPFLGLMDPVAQDVLPMQPLAGSQFAGENPQS